MKEDPHAQRTSAILLAGGKGTRLQSLCPKQFLPLVGKPIICYSLDILCAMKAIAEVIVVCDPIYRKELASYPVLFADPGARRQDSLFSALQRIHPATQWVLVHDAARPFITETMVEHLLAARSTHRAATLGIPVTSTIKMVHEGEINQTIDRTHLWESHTPQLIAHEIAIQGFSMVHSNHLTITDDVALAELVGAPIAIIPSLRTNIKITTREDVQLAQFLAQPKASHRSFSHPFAAVKQIFSSQWKIKNYLKKAGIQLSNSLRVQRSSDEI